jgi:hypothetical protein
MAEFGGWVPKYHLTYSAIQPSAPANEKSLDDTSTRAWLFHGYELRTSHVFSQRQPPSPPSPHPRRALAHLLVRPVVTMIARPASSKALMGVSHRIAPTATSASRLATTGAPASQQSRGLATVQDTPVRHYGGLQDQDRIFQNLYGRHPVDLKTAQKFGDWHKTKEIILKGHEWVRAQLVQLRWSQLC